jgi:hypothetical protein
VVLERVQVREQNEVGRTQMIRRIEETPVVVSSEVMTGTQSAQDTQKSLETQRQEILANLRSQPVSGRLVINISSDISRSENTPADLELRAGDTLLIPKRLDFVAVSGQVYNPVAISYSPRVEPRLVFANRAARHNPATRAKFMCSGPMGNSWVSSSFTDTRIRPGDTIFVPEKIIGSSQLWRNILGAAQVASAAALPFAFAGVI